MLRDSAAAGTSNVTDMQSLHRWSVERPTDFWPAVWRFCGVVSEDRGTAAAWDAVGYGLDRMAPPDPERGPTWFPGARLNFAENLLRRTDDRAAVVSWNELGRQRVLSFAELDSEVGKVAAALVAEGVGVGNRVAGFLPNIPETLIAMLATATIGAVWSSCSPDFGASGVLDRFGQIGPMVLFCADGYRYAGKQIDSLARVREVRARIPGIRRVVVIPYVGDAPALHGLP
ncbi:MAG: AMP-binding protein, partial [Gemmatimonadales bacterium]|nr:AMP-binding protein [Gemmatimonadales bacterium]